MSGNHYRDGETHRLSATETTLLTGEVVLTCSCGWQHRAAADRVYNDFVEHRQTQLILARKREVFWIAGAILVGISVLIWALAMLAMHGPAPYTHHPIHHERKDYVE